MTDIAWVMYAGAAAWVGIGLYVFFLARAQSALAIRIERMQRIMEDEG